MLLSRKNGLDSLVKEVRVFKVREMLLQVGELSPSVEHPIIIVIAVAGELLRTSYTGVDKSSNLEFLSTLLFFYVICLFCSALFLALFMSLFLEVWEESCFNWRLPLHFRSATRNKPGNTLEKLSDQLFSGKLIGSFLFGMLSDVFLV